MKILVTGGAGFQGSNLCKKLLQQGHNVTILNTLSERSQQNIERFNLQKATIVWGSITDSQIVEKTVRDHDVVYHLAANIHVDDSIANPEAYYRTNVLGTLNVAEACRPGLKPATPLIHVSSCEVYGGCETCDKANNCAQEAITETCPLKPKSPYAASKAAADSLVYAHAITYGTPTIIVRPGNVFGIGQRFGKRGAVIPIFTNLALRDSAITINGDGSQTRDFISVSSLVQAYIQLLDKIPSGDKPLILNLSSSCEIRIKAIAETIQKAAHSRRTINYGEPRPGEVKGFHLNSRKANGLGINPSYNFGETISEYVRWFRKYEMEKVTC